MRDTISIHNPNVLISKALEYKEKMDLEKKETYENTKTEKKH